MTLVQRTCSPAAPAAAAAAVLQQRRPSQPAGLLGVQGCPFPSLQRPAAGLASAQAPDPVRASACRRVGSWLRSAAVPAVTVAASLRRSGSVQCRVQAGTGTGALLTSAETARPHRLHCSAASHLALSIPQAALPKPARRLAGSIVAACCRVTLRCLQVAWFRLPQRTPLRATAVLAAAASAVGPEGPAAAPWLFCPACTADHW